MNIADIIVLLLLGCCCIAAVYLIKHKKHHCSGCSGCKEQMQCSENTSSSCKKNHSEIK